MTIIPQSWWDSLRPSTLAAIVADCDEALESGEDLTHSTQTFRDSAFDALVQWGGDVEATRLVREERNKL
jgi:hypothetical protein